MRYCFISAHSFRINDEKSGLNNLSQDMSEQHTVSNIGVIKSAPIIENEKHRKNNKIANRDSK